ncbi:Rhodopsin orphan GPCR [Fasciolopsis buskii]|uniref:Rhodopsin orphan GPCR n=1 Tax=Fasciolopsis buskii TaxID=27845 RepID=A0A8E0RWX3_9TREM|nr:Rhodopsin orphan GPCR [Fasciolopsis buski]
MSTETNEAVGPLNCSQRYELNQTNIDPVSINERYQTCEFLAVFFPDILTLVRCLMLIWLITGLFGNTLSLVIWSTKHQRRRNTSAIYLSALAVTDLTLILCLLNYHLERYWCLRGITSFPILCQIYQCLSIFSQYYSTALVFGFTLERYLAVCFPFKRHKLCTHKRALVAVLCLLVICCIPMLFQAALWTFENGECVMRTSMIQDNRVTQTLTAQEVIFSLIVPLAALVLNILVLFEMRRLIHSRAAPSHSISGRNGTGFSRASLKHRKSSAISVTSAVSVQTNPNTAETRSRETSSFTATTIMLVILSFYLIACTVPPGIVYLTQFYLTAPDDCLTVKAAREDPTWQQIISSTTLKEIIDVLCSSHYALNFFIYILTYKGFREHAIWILTCNVSKLRRVYGHKQDKLFLPRRTGPRLPSTVTIPTNEEVKRLYQSNNLHPDSLPPDSRSNSVN